MQSHAKAPKGSIGAPEAMEQTAWTLDETGVAQAKNWLRERGGANTTASPADKDELADKLGVLPVKRRRAAPRISSRIMWLTHSPSVPGGTSTAQKLHRGRASHSSFVLNGSRGGPGLHFRGKC